jgi:hypothetical protein
MRTDAPEVYDTAVSAPLCVGSNEWDKREWGARLGQTVSLLKGYADLPQPGLRPTAVISREYAEWLAETDPEFWELDRRYHQLSYGCGQGEDLCAARSDCALADFCIRASTNNPQT